MGARFVIDYAKSQPKREARQRITRGETETSVEGFTEFLFVLDLFFSLPPNTHTHTHTKKTSFS